MGEESHIIRCLTDETKRKILDLLTRSQDRKSIFEISEELGFSNMTAFRHIKALQEARIVRSVEVDNPDRPGRPSKYWEIAGNVSVKIRLTEDSIDEITSTEKSIYEITSHEKSLKEDTKIITRIVKRSFGSILTIENGVQQVHSLEEIDETLKAFDRIESFLLARRQRLLRQQDDDEIL